MALTVLSKEQLEKLSTKRLLAYKRKLYLEVCLDDLLDGCDCTECLAHYAQQEEVSRRIAMVTNILNGREHCERENPIAASRRKRKQLTAKWWFSCSICKGKINKGEKYQDLGYDKKAHLKCVKI